VDHNLHFVGLANKQGSFSARKKRASVETSL
jgi:hypothetical protein